jgi:hypothetical protein
MIDAKKALAQSSLDKTLFGWPLLWGWTTSAPDATQLEEW